MPIIAWLLDKLTGKVALPIIAVLALTNIASGTGLLITRLTLSNVKSQLATEKLVHQADIDHISAAMSAAMEDDEKNALRVQAAQQQIATETQNALKAQIADARTVADKWLRAHPATAAGSGGTSGLPATADPASGANGPPAAAIVPSTDIEACAQDYVIAKGWQDWWKRVQPTMVDSSVVSSREHSLDTNIAFGPISVTVGALDHGFPRLAFADSPRDHRENASYAIANNGRDNPGVVHRNFLP